VARVPRVSDLPVESPVREARSTSVTRAQQLGLRSSADAASPLRQRGCNAGRCRLSPFRTEEHCGHSSRSPERNAIPGPRNDRPTTFSFRLDRHTGGRAHTHHSPNRVERARSAGATTTNRAVERGNARKSRPTASRQRRRRPARAARRSPQPRISSSSRRSRADHLSVGTSLHPPRPRPAYYRRRAVQVCVQNFTRMIKRRPPGQAFPNAHHGEWTVNSAEADRRRAGEARGQLVREHSAVQYVVSRLHTRSRIMEPQRLVSRHARPCPGGADFDPERGMRSTVSRPRVSAALSTAAGLTGPAAPCDEC